MLSQWNQRERHQIYLIESYTNHHANIFYWVLLGFTGFWRVGRGFFSVVTWWGSGFYRRFTEFFFFKGFHRFYRVFWGFTETDPIFTGSYRVLLGFTSVYGVLSGYLRFYRVLLVVLWSSVGCFKVFIGSYWVWKVDQVFTGFYWVFQGLNRFLLGFTGFH